MAELVGIVHTSHGGFTTTPSELWEEKRRPRSFRADTPRESQAEMDAKWARTLGGIAALRDKVASYRPDVLVVFGDDQEECFEFTNHPSLALYVGERFEGKVPGPVVAGAPVLRHDAPGHPGLATHLLTGLLSSGFDPAFMLDLPRPEVGMCHAVMNPLAFFTDFEIPTVPVLVNAYYAPQMSARRCVELGRTVRPLLNSYPEDLRVVVVGSGGLWHTPGQELSWLNEEFDHKGLSFLERGDISAWAEMFDGYRVPEDDPSQAIAAARRGVTGLPSPSGPQFGTRESLCWIAAAATAEGREATVVDYVPVYASPVGNAFAFCDTP